MARRRPVLVFFAILIIALLFIGALGYFKYAQISGGHRSGQKLPDASRSGDHDHGA